ncbi:hypothetical protein [Actinomadura sp. NEAU-AAG7]|uniref:hypothetical protein n=1 Tax=Actinomadura sp. NEAU-AAG7 TaxID=2839640 RepID=UPI001BE42D28|nr:hypothetical protein [Actinomadura sp. NEAU-AAG7]MBT2213484.1 hypothetical protein [Actinomadura sp. NEAU-AAG7]
MSRERAKGTAAETAVVHYLRGAGFPHVERRAGAGRLDAGDIAGIVGVVIEVKAHARTELAAWLDETRRETANGHADYGAVWHKRRGKGSPADWFVTLDGATFTRLLKAALNADT